MATQRWVGNSIAIAQQSTVTVGGTAANGQVYSVTINSKTLSYTANVSDTNTTIATALQAVLTAATAPAEFLEVTWTNPSAGVILGTAVTPGVPFTNTSSATGTGTLVTATTVSNSGPSDISIASNWSTGSVPVNGDDIYFDIGGVPDALYNLQTLSAVTPNSIHVLSSFTSNIGLLDFNGAYAEYRQRYFQVQGVTTQLIIGEGQGQGSGRLKFDTGSAATTLIVQNTAQPNEFGGQSVRWKGTNATNVVQVIKGNVGLAASPGDAANVLTLDVAYRQNVAGDATIFCGSGMTLVSGSVVNMTGGTVIVNSSIQTAIQSAGSLTVNGISLSVNLWSIYGGTGYYNSTGNINTLNVGNGGTINFTQDLRGRTITTTNLYKGAIFNDFFATVGFINPFQLVRCRMTEVTVDNGQNRAYQVSGSQ